MNNKEKTIFISEWIKNYSLNNNINALVIGISGGIDSAVTSTLSAMTGLKTIVVSMPILDHQNLNQRGLNHIKWLKNNFSNVESIEINLADVFSSFRLALNKNNSEHGYANTQARLRMTTLYQIAASNNGLVVGTGNKVEDFGIGFYTKYGDGGVDISPIADCLKTEVWGMAKELGIDAICQAQVHDQLIVNVDEKDAEMFAPHVQEIMETTTILPGVTLKAPPEISDNWRDGH